MQAGMESCATKLVMSGVAGAGMGAVFGLFMSSVRPSSSMRTHKKKTKTRLTKNRWWP